MRLLTMATLFDLVASILVTLEFNGFLNLLATRPRPFEKEAIPFDRLRW